MTAIILLGCLVIAPACSTGPTVGGGPITASTGVPSQWQVAGDWNDVAASVYFAVRDEEVAILAERSGAEDDIREFELLTIRDEPGLLIAKRSGRSANGSEPITFAVRIGAFGDAAREQRLLQRIARRLTDLAGVEFRPIP